MMINILIIEDTKLHQEEIKKTISELGYNVCGCFNNGEEAVHYIINNNAIPDLAIISIILQRELNGYEVARKIFSDEDIPIILTGMENDLRDTDFDESDVYTYLNKPFNNQELTNNIELVLHRCRSHQHAKQQFKIIKTQKERLASILEGTNVGTWEWNVQTGEFIFNQRWAEIIGYTLEEFLPFSIDTWMENIHPEDLEESNKILERHFTGEIDYYDVECRMEHKNGHWVWVQDSGRVISWTEDGKPLWMFGALKDISGRKQVEEEHAKLSNEYETVLKSTQDAMFLVEVVDQNTFRFSRNNLAHSQALNLDLKEIQGKTPEEFLGEELGSKITANCKRCLQKQEAISYDEVLDLSRGERTWSTTLTPVLIDNEVTYIVGSSRDITEQKLIEEQLRENEERIKSLSNNLPDSMVYQVDFGEDGSSRAFTYVSAGVESLHGITASEAIEDASVIYNQIIEEDRSLLAKEEAESMANMSNFQMEFRVRRPSGENRWHMVSSSPRRLANNHLVWDGFEIDITERKLMEDALTKSEKRLNTMMNNSPDMVVRFNTDLQHIYCNEAVERELGIPPDFFIGKTFMDLDIPHLENEIIHSMHQFLVKCLETGEKQFYSTELMAPSGLKYYSTIIIPERNEKSFRTTDWEGRIESLLAVTRDITKQKQAEETIKKREELFQEMLSLVPDMISIHDPNMNIVYSNWSGFGNIAKEKRVLNTKCYKTYRGLEDICPDCQAINVLQTKNSFQKEVELPEGKWVDLRVIPLLGQDGSVKFFMEWVRDITKHKQMEQEIKESNEKLNGILNNMKDVAWSISWPDLTPLYIGSSVEMLYGRNIQEFFDNPSLFKEIIHPEDQYLIEKAIEQLPEEGEFRRESRVVKPDGSIIWINDKSKMIYDENHQPIRVEGLAQDITKRKQMEEKIQYQHDFQKVVANISYNFINTPSSLMDEAINNALYQIGTFFHVDRSYLLQFSSDDLYVSNTHEWCREGIEPQIDRIQNQPVEEMPWIIKEIRSKECVFIPDVNAMVYEEEREEFQRQGIQSLLSIPIKVKDRVTGFIGMDAVTEKMIFMEEEITLLKVISEIMSSAFSKHQMEQELINHSQEVEKLNHHLSQEMEKGHRIHNNILPKDLPSISGISFASYYQPAEKLDGNFLDVIQADNRLVIYLSDISGHGLDGGMINFFVKEAIDSYITLKPDELSPGKILRHVERQYRRETYPDEMFICIFLAVLDLETLELTYTGAGFQDTPFVSQGHGEQAILSTKGLFINSIFPIDKNSFQEKTIVLTPGSTIFFNTDGLTEQGEPGAFYRDRLRQVFYKNAHLPSDAISQAVVEDFRQFNNGSLQGDDDITFLILQVEPESRRYEIELTTDFEELEYLQNKALSILSNADGSDSIISCLYELVANAMEHGNQMDPTKRVTVEIVFFHGYIQLSVEDEGAGFSWQDKVDKPLELDGLAERGRGIAMVGILSDNLFYNDRGNKVIFIIKSDQGSSMCR